MHDVHEHHGALATTLIALSAVIMLCRYVYKGHDRAIAQVAADGSEAEVVDELKSFQAGRYYSSCEAIWRYLQFPLYQQSHTVQRLPVHLPNQQNVTFSDNNDL